MNNVNKTVLIDMDGVMADFDARATSHLLPEEIVERAQFYVARDYPSDQRISIEAAYNTPGFFEDLEPMPGILEGWQKLIDNGYHPRVASAPLSGNPTAIEGKIKWLDKLMVPEFGSSVVSEAIIDKDKWKYDGLALIDDRPGIPRGPNGQNMATWEHVLFGWPHLDKVPLAQTAFRLLHWQNTAQLIHTLETITAMRDETDAR
jgi:5'-nucleotidase